MVDVANKLGLPQYRTQCSEWLVPLPKNKLPQPERLAFPLPAKDKEGNFILPKSNDLNSTNTRKRTHEQSELENHHSQTLNRRALVAPVMNKQPTAEQLALRTTNGGTVTTNGRARISIARIGDKNKLISWTDAPDDLFVSTEATKYV